jgi:hypothetical protein
MTSVLRGRELHVRMDSIRRTDPTLTVPDQPAPEAWNVQLFRSIDSGAWGTSWGTSPQLKSRACACVPASHWRLCP